MALLRLGSVKLTDQLLANSVNLASEVTGDLGTAHLNGGSGASSTTFWRGDAQWATPVVDVSSVVGTLSVAHGGTGLTSGTSGGVLYFSGTTTVASSTALAANQIVLGGGAGQPPATLGSLGATNTVLHGNAAGAPSFSAIVAGDLDSTLKVVFGAVSWGTAGAESANTIEITGTVLDANGVAIAAATSDVKIVVSDAVTDGEPSATATIAAAASPVGTVLAGTGTATIVMRTNASGQFAIAVTDVSVASRYLNASQGVNSQAFIRAAAGPKQLTFT